MKNLAIITLISLSVSCAVTDPPSDAATNPKECAELGNYGSCEGNTLKYCDEKGKVQEVQCGDYGKWCYAEVCYNGAACCDGHDYIDECNRLGSWGECGGQDGNVLRYCENGKIIQNECPAGQSCQKTCNSYGMPECC